MSATKNYIDNMMDQGIDVLRQENMDEEYFEKMYLESIKEMNDMFGQIEFENFQNYKPE